MSNHLAIATVTAALRKRLESALTADLTDISVAVNHARPAGSNNGQTPDPSVNIFLYQVSPNGAMANADLPTRSSGGRLVSRPSVALDLHYLMTFYGDETQLVPQRIMGSVVRTLECKPVVTRDLVQAVTTDPSLVYLSASDLALAIETVKFIPESFSLEEMSKLWSVFFQTPYGLSVAYRASVVVIEATEQARQVLPVAERDIFVGPASTLGPAISPSEFSGLQLWLKSDVGLTYDSEGVSQWTDQSSNGNNAVQPNASRRPQLVAHGLGGKPVLRFDGDDDYLAIENLSYTTIGEISEITVCALVRSSSSDPQIIVSFDSDQYWRLALRDGADQGVGWNTTDSSNSISNLRVTDATVDGRWHLILASFAVGTSPDKHVFIDGVVAVHATAHGGNSLGTGSTRFGFVGTGSEADSFDGSRGPDWHLHGDLAELLIFHHAFTDDERAQLERYFVNRYRG